MPIHHEPELSAPVKLCTGGQLNRAAVGWSRLPLHTCNVTGHWPRKKKWNWWGFSDGQWFLSVVVADMDYIGAAAVMLLDVEARTHVQKETLVPLAAGMRLGTQVDEDVRFHQQGTKVVFAQTPKGLSVEVSVKDLDGAPLHASLSVTRPKDHESLNVVIPWDDDHFQFTSKQHGLPVAGTVRHGGAEHAFSPEDTFAVHDYGRGVWPYHTRWNWGAGIGHSGGHTVGLQLGGKWTDGTGMTENGVLVDGRLTKISEDLTWTYDVNNFMTPWRIHAPESEAVALTFTPAYQMAQSTNMVVVQSQLNVLYGHFNGTVKAGGETLKVKDFFGWCEEHDARW